MTADLIREFIRRQPFKPFTIRMNDRRKFGIKHPDFVALFPNGSCSAIVFLGGERFEIIYLRNVTGIESEGAVPQASRRRRGRGNGSEEE
jgi:hypothetical protein